MRSQQNRGSRLNSVSQRFQPGFVIIAGVLVLGTIGCGDSGNSEYVEFKNLPSQPAPPTPIQPETTASDATTEDSASIASEASDAQVTDSQITAAEPTDGIPTAIQPVVAQTTADTPPAATPATESSESQTASTDGADAARSDVIATPPVSPANAAQETIPATEASASQTAPDGSVVTVTGPLEIKLLIPEKTFRAEKNSTALRVSYDDIDLLKVLNMEPVPVDAVEYFPEWLKSLDGATIRIRGFMYPTYEATGLTGFTLARDNGICCFVRQPKIYDIIAVQLAPGVTSDYIEGKPFDVEGTFRIQPESDETDLFRLYRIENARVLR